MITKEQVLQILLKNSRNGGDYVPDYQFENIAKEISNFGKVDEDKEAEQWEDQREAMFNAWERNQKNDD